MPNAPDPTGNPFPTDPNKEPIPCDVPAEPAEDEEIPLDSAE